MCGYHYAECAGFTMFIVRHHMPHMGMMLMLTKHNGNELKQKYIVVISDKSYQLSAQMFIDI